MANNVDLKNAAIAGLSGGSQERWITDDNSSSYTAFAAVIQVFATEIDAAIPVIPGGASAAEAQLLQGLCQGIAATRLPNSLVPAHYTPIARAVAAIWQELRGELGPVPTGAVTSVFGRTGNVVAATDDYQASQINNNSGVGGTGVSGALDTLAAQIAALVTGVSSVFGRTGAVTAQTNDYSASQINNNSGVGGTGVSGALNTLAAQIAALVTGVSSVFGRTGAVTAQTDDYSASQINNNSGVIGTGVSGALNTLATSALFHWGAVASSASTGSRYFIRTFGAVSTTEAQGQLTVGRACTITGIRISCGTASPTDSITVTLRLGGVSTAVTVTLPVGGTSAVATGFSLALAAGDRIAMQMTQSGTDTVSTWNADVVVF